MSGKTQTCVGMLLCALVGVASADVGYLSQGTVLLPEGEYWPTSTPSGYFTDVAADCSTAAALDAEGYVSV